MVIIHLLHPAHNKPTTAAAAKNIKRREASKSGSADQGTDLLVHMRSRELALRRRRFRHDSPNSTARNLPESSILEAK